MAFRPKKKAVVRVLGWYFLLTQIQNSGFRCCWPNFELRTIRVKMGDIVLQTITSVLIGSQLEILSSQNSMRWAKYQHLVYTITHTYTYIYIHIYIYIYMYIHAQRHFGRRARQPLLTFTMEWFLRNLNKLGTWWCLCFCDDDLDHFDRRCLKLRATPGSLPYIHIQYTYIIYLIVYILHVIRVCYII